MLLSTAQACGAIGKGRATLAKLIKAGEIKAFKGPARNSHLRIPLESIQRYLERNQMSVGGDQ
ncbi:helix-turn-helix domain-containing protein [Streptosporangium sp. G12]